MSILYCRDCGVDISGEPLFRQVSFAIELGEKVGLVGPNGAGKTTLLRACLGEIGLESGQVQLTGSYGYLPQMVFLNETGTVYDNMLRIRSEILEMREQLHILEKKMSEIQEEKLYEQYAGLIEKYERASGYELEASIRKILAGLGLDKEVSTPVEYLSGGQKTRLALSQLLLRAPDLLILDEPTNHLDIYALEWLEGFLKEYPGAVLVVSHDRYFLNRLVSKILHLEHGSLKTYPGSYSEYELQRAIEEKTLAREAERINRKIARLEEYVRRNKAGVNAKQARGREAQLKKLKPLETPKPGKQIKLSLQSEHRSGDKVLSIRELSISFSGRKLLENINLELQRGDKVALHGKNGVGKTSFFKAILGHIPYEGEIRLGANVKPAYYSQEHEDLNLGCTIMDEIRAGSDLKDLEIRSLLARFGFSGEEVFKPVGVLSGGEKSRLALAKLFLTKGNLLLLDEPTNHLDAQTREVLEEALLEYDGTVLVVSHDRYFLDKVVNKVAHLTPERLDLHDGDYTTYKKHQELSKEQVGELRHSRSDGEKNSAYRENQETKREAQRKKKYLAKLEERISELESLLQNLEEELSQTGSDYEKAAELHKTYEENKNLLDLALEEWLQYSSGVE